MKSQWVWLGLLAASVLNFYFPSPTEAVERRCLVQSLKTLEVFRAENRIYRFTTAEENGDFIKWVENRDSLPSDAVFVHIEAILKELNDRVFKDKDLVNAVLNRYRKILSTLLRSDPLLKESGLKIYSDPKTIRLSVVPKGGNREALVHTVQKIYEESTRQFQLELESIPEIKALLAAQRGFASHLSLFQRAGIGHNAEQAEIIARSERTLGIPPQGQPLIREFDSSIELLKKRIDEIDSLQSELASSREIPSDLFVNYQGTRLLSLDVIDILRKIKANDLNEFCRVLQGALSRRFPAAFRGGLQLSQSTLIQMSNYFTEVSEFSLSFLQKTREIIDFKKGGEGAVSIDIAGLGTENIFEAMRAMVDAQSTKAKSPQGEGLPTDTTINRVLVREREAEKKVTGRMQDIKVKLGQVFGKVSGLSTQERLAISGDDSVWFGAMNGAQKRALLRELYQADLKNVRVTFLPKGIPEIERSPLIVAQELLEKEIRLNLEESLSKQKSVSGVIDQNNSYKDTKNFIIGIDLTVNARGEKGVNLLVFGKINPWFKQQIRQIFNLILSKPGAPFKKGEVSFDEAPESHGFILKHLNFELSVA